jgi:hypothetical protein
MKRNTHKHITLRGPFYLTVLLNMTAAADGFPFIDIPLSLPYPEQSMPCARVSIVLFQA